jgi:hypothetical protein
MSASIWYVAAIVMLTAAWAANAAPLPGGDLAGRERYRFVDPPAVRGMEPAPSIAPRWEAPGYSVRCRDRRRAKAHRSASRDRC